MAPRTNSPTPPSTHEHLCQAAEAGRWSLVLTALSLPPAHTVDIRSISRENETRLGTAALQQGQWCFLKMYVSRGYCAFQETFETILMSAVKKGLYNFVPKTLFAFQSSYNYRWEWLVAILAKFLRDDLHLTGARKVAMLLPRTVPQEKLEVIVTIAERLKTDHTQRKNLLLDTFYHILEGYNSSVSMQSVDAGVPVSPVMYKARRR